jgi:hypothetical protein
LSDDGSGRDAPEQRFLFFKEIRNCDAAKGYDENEKDRDEHAKRFSIS